MHTISYAPSGIYRLFENLRKEGRLKYIYIFIGEEGLSFSRAPYTLKKSIENLQEAFGEGDSKWSNFF